VRLENALKGQFSRGTTLPIVDFFMDPSPKARVFMKTIKIIIISLAVSALLSACGKKEAEIAIDHGCAIPGSTITKKGEKISLTGTPIEIGQPLPDTNLIDAKTMSPVNLNEFKGSVLFLSIVPSIDTKVCEVQSHYLGEEGDKLPAEIKRFTISRDTPFAQKRFAEEAKLNNIQFLSDYKEGAFGRATGLLIDGSMLLARSVIIIDKEGVVQYIQVVPEITNLPDMAKAFVRAIELSKLN
jgi:thiol peroxidase